MNGFSVDALAVFDDGTGTALFAGGSFSQAGGTIASNTAKWNGSSWFPLANGTNDRVRTFSVFDSQLIAGGEFVVAGNAAAGFVAAWSGSSWLELGTHGGNGVNHGISALLAFDDGSGSALYAGGAFEHAGDLACSSIARWDGSQWSPLADGLQSPPFIGHQVSALASYDDGQGPALYAAGFFTHSG